MRHNPKEVTMTATTPTTNLSLWQAARKVLHRRKNGLTIPEIVNLVTTRELWTTTNHTPVERMLWHALHRAEVAGRVSRREDSERGVVYTLAS
jgi:hypothetical protein